MFDFWPVYSGERFRASWPSCLYNIYMIRWILDMYFCSFCLSFEQMSQGMLSLVENFEYLVDHLSGIKPKSMVVGMYIFQFLFSSPGRSPGRAIVLPPASALASAAAALANVKVFTFKFFMWWARRCQASCPVPVTGLVSCSLLLYLLPW